MEKSESNQDSSNSSDGRKHEKLYNHRVRDDYDTEQYR